LRTPLWFVRRGYQGTGVAVPFDYTGDVSEQLEANRERRGARADDRREATRRSDDAIVLRLIRERGGSPAEGADPLTQRTVEQLAGIPKDRARAACTRLVAAGSVTRMIVSDPRPRQGDKDVFVAAPEGDDATEIGLES
jgi:hypothetical protein